MERRQEPETSLGIAWNQFNSGQNCGKLAFFKSYKDVTLVPPGHATVDAKVDGVGEEDAGVDEHGHSVGQLIVNEVQVHAGICT